MADHTKATKPCPFCKGSGTVDADKPVTAVAPETEVERLRADCLQAYLAVGVLADSLGWWQMQPDHPWHRPIEKLLDNLAAAGDGEPRPHDDLLPFILKAMARD